MTDLFSSKAPVFKVNGEVKGELARDVSHLEIEEATDGLKALTLALIAEGPRGNAPEEQLLYLDGAMVDRQSAASPSSTSARTAGRE